MDTLSVPAPYGRACTNCVRTKCRCIYRVGAPNCERCHRLGKECVPSVSIRKQNARGARNSRTAHLGKKLSDLVSLLENHTATGRHPDETVPAGPLEARPVAANDPVPALTLDPSATNPLQLPSNSDFNFNTPIDPSLYSPGSSSSTLTPQHQLSSDSFTPARSNGNSIPNRGLELPHILVRVFHPPPTSSPPPEPTPSDIPPCPYLPTALEAEENLATFRQTMLPFFPFFYLSPSMTAKRLRDLYPFFWFNIMTVTHKHVDEQYAMSEAVWQFVGERMIVRHEKSLDLLWGLMVLMTWTHYHRKEKPYFSVLASLVKSLVYDFCLNKPSRPPGMAICVRSREEPLPPREKTMDEKRAVLACFYITSQISHVMKRVDALVWTPYLDECLRQLSREPSWEGDELLVVLVRIQLLTEQLTRAIWQSPESVAPAYFSSALKSQLLDLREKLPAQMLENPTVTAHILFLELSIIQSVDLRPIGKVSFAPDLQRFENLEACLQLIKRWFGNHFTIPANMLMGVTFMHWCNMGDCLMSLGGLVFDVEDPAWDRRAAKERVDLFGILDRIIQGFDVVSDLKRRQSREGVEQDMFTRVSRMVRGTKSDWLALTINTDQTLPAGTVVSPQDTLAHAEDPILYHVDQWDNDWKDLFFEMN